MTKLIICSVVKREQLPNFLCLIQSVENQVGNVGFVAACIGFPKPHLELQKKNFPQVTWVDYKDLFSFRDLVKIGFRYLKQKSDRFLIGMIKPFAVEFVIKRFLGDVIYCDPTLFFEGSPEPIIRGLRDQKTILIPNGFTLNPNRFEEFTRHFLEGYYTASIIGFSSNSLNHVVWWKKVTSFACEQNRLKGYYYEQAYLNFLPVMYENTEITKSNTVFLHLDNFSQMSDSEEICVVNYTDELIEKIQGSSSTTRIEKWERYKRALARHHD